jgi:hypothetical protein
MSDLLEKKPKREKLTEPPKRWQNWYRANKVYFSISLQRDVAPGEVYANPRVFPSKEVAEQKHLEDDAYLRGALGGAEVPGEYLGAFPVTP